MTNPEPPGGLGWPERPGEHDPDAGGPDAVPWADPGRAVVTDLEPFAADVPLEGGGSGLPERYARRAARMGLGWPGSGRRPGAGRKARASSAPDSGESEAASATAGAAGSGHAADPGGPGGLGSGVAAQESGDQAEPAPEVPERVRQALAAVSRETVAAVTGAARTADPDAREDEAGQPGAGEHAADDDGSRASAGERESEGSVSISAASADTPIARAAQAAVVARAGGESWPQPAACRVITIANQKGGVGKTTTAVNLAASLAMHGGRVLVVDLDPQGNASTALDVEHHSGVPSVYNVLVDGDPLGSVVRPVAGFPHLYCAPAAIDLAGAEIELVPMVARESRLARALSSYDSSSLDYIFIDCPPSLGLLTVNALVAAPEVMIPIQCEYYALEGLEQLLRTIELVRSHLNPTLAVTTILLTMYDGRTRLASQVADEVREHFGGVVLGPVIPRSVRVSEAPSYGQPVMTYDPGSTGALAYLEAARELAFRNVPTVAS